MIFHNAFWGSYQTKGNMSFKKVAFLNTYIYSWFSNKQSVMENL